jgi:hypothetical protein
MNNETKFPTHETPPINPLDAEFDTVETELDGHDQLVMTRQLMEEIFRPGAKTEYRQFIENEQGELIPNKNYQKEKFERFLKNERARGNNQLKHFLLPEIPGGTGDLKTIREHYDERSNYLKSERHLFARVGQGEIWIVPCQENPYLLVSMSECSALIGKTDEKIIIAHISYSMPKQISATIEFMKTQGIQTDSIYAIASTGQHQTKRAQTNLEERFTSSKDYLDLGLLPQNIKEFSYDFGPDDRLGRSTMRNLTELIVCNDGIFKYSFDLLNDRYAQGAYFQTFIDGSYRDEEIVKMS